ncbi:uncharacterized protein LOC107199023 [Parus major]|uniref:uncharacterized protein LOC107199023 n=1 Tax=Parus major TaxID=9157 RepID=UPI0014443A7C|nr:uncharacterized protein LOC107199023 [Parus major]
MAAQNASGNTALHLCALYNQESCARVLLFRGASKEIRNYNSQTAFQVAIIAGNFELAEIIKTHKESDVGELDFSRFSRFFFSLWIPGMDWGEFSWIFPGVVSMDFPGVASMEAAAALGLGNVQEIPVGFRFSRPGRHSQTLEFAVKSRFFASLRDFIPKILGFGARRENPPGIGAKLGLFWLDLGVFLRNFFGILVLQISFPLGEIPGKNGFGSGIKSPLVEFPWIILRNSRIRRCRWRERWEFPAWSHGISSWKKEFREKKFLPGTEFPENSLRLLLDSWNSIPKFGAAWEGLDGI